MFKVGNNPISDLTVPKEVRELDVNGDQFYKLHKVITEDLFRMEALNMSGMQLTEVITN